MHRYLTLWKRQRPNFFHGSAQIKTPILVADIRSVYNRALKLAYNGTDTGLQDYKLHAGGELATLLNLGSSGASQMF